tara:strand:- start:116 stop:529 length:414 start_codon:yes stop_codon:yes gene_type:complete
MGYKQTNNPFKRITESPEIVAAKNDPMFSEKYPLRDNAFQNPTLRSGLDKMIINESDPDIIARLLNDRRRYEDEYNIEDIGARRNFENDEAFVNYLKRQDQEFKLKEAFGDQWEMARGMIDSRSGKDLGDFEKYRIR